jgi:hypothetical protein
MYIRLQAPIPERRARRGAGHARFFLLHDAGSDGSLRPANGFAIVSNTTHYPLAVEPMLPEIVERFLGTK